MDKKRKAIEEFELMLNKAELRVLSKLSLKQPLTERQFVRMKSLMKKVI